MKRKESEGGKENQGESSGKRRRISSSGVLSEIISLYGRQSGTSLAEDDFVLCRRLGSVQEEALLEGIHAYLSEELVLRVFSWLDKGTLGRLGSVCKKWHRLSQDESLWKRLDLGSKTLSLPTLLSLAQRGILALRLSKVFILEPSTTTKSQEERPKLKLQYLDLSMADLSLDSLKAILRGSQQLLKISLEQCPLDEETGTLLAQNKELRVLSLPMAKGLTSSGLKNILSSSNSLQELNMAWTEPSEEIMEVLANHLPPSITRLNISGAKEHLTDKILARILQKAPKLLELDVSDAGSLSEESMDSLLLHSRHLEHLHVSRCYGISPNAYITLGVVNSLKYLEVFGVMKDTAIAELRLHLPGILINKQMFSTVARPTVGNRKTSIWNVRVRD